VRLLQSGGEGLETDEPPAGLDAARLAALGIAGTALFGAANGLTQGGATIALAAGKAVAIALFALLVCAPSLLVLAALSGTTWNDRAFARAFLRFWAVVGVALAALAPISFLFASSSRYLGSVVLTAVAFEVVAVLLGRRLLAAAGASGAASGLWIVLVLVVAFQATTLARPVLFRVEGDRLWAFERRGFLEQLNLATEVRLDGGRSAEPGR
jgi:hypothetical protein